MPDETGMEVPVNPEIGQWYMRGDKGEKFWVTAYDEGSGTIEIQTFDGDVDEFDLEGWNSMSLERTVEPEDWTGPLDEIDIDDLGYSEDTEMTAADWAEPLRPFQPREEAWRDDVPEDQEDADDGNPDPGAPVG